MKLSWTFYPKDSKFSVTLTVIYIPELDNHDLQGGGFLHELTNTAYTNWETYRRFDNPSVEDRKDAYARLVRINNGGGIILGEKQISLTATPS